MLKLNNSVLRSYLAHLGHKTVSGELELIGLRGCVPVGPDSVELVDNRPDLYNDTLIAYGPEFELFLASVDPGDAWTQNPSNPNGCAHLLNGQWLYKRGPHRGNPALVQAAPVKVWRDRDKDHARDPHEMVDEGWFGLNIHAGGVARVVGRNSAGCQIIHGGWEGKPWRTFRGLIDGRPGQRTFRYSLMDAVGLARFIGGAR